MSDEAVKRAVDSAAEIAAADEQDELWKVCPVVCLGQRLGVYHFIAASGEKREFQVRDFTPNGLLSLFDGDRAWLMEKFPRMGNDGKTVVDFQIRLATGALMRRCANAGLWNPETPIRGIGVWRGEKAGDAVVVHCGDVLMVEERGKLKFVPAGKHWGRAIYPAAPEQQRPATAPATADQAKDVLAALNLWQYEFGVYKARLLLGAIALDALGAAPAWRVHVLITTQHGGGKTTLSRLIRRLLGAGAVGLNDFTEAGLRQLFTGTARAGILDEGEGDVQFNRIELVIQFLRRMSGEEGLESVRGSAGGTAQNFSAASPAVLSAIDPPTLLPQDRSRFLELELLRADPKNSAKVEEAVAMAEALSPAFRARSIMGWSRFRQNLLVYRDALFNAGCDPRQADKFGALLAAGDMMLIDEAVDAVAAEAGVLEIHDIIAETIMEDDEASDAKQCLSTLLTRQVEHWQGGSKSTIGRLLYAAINDNETGAAKALKVYGLRVEAEKLTDGSGQRWWLFVANRHEGLSIIFRDTRWHNGAWKRSLLRLKDAKRSALPVRFDGVKERAAQIPQEHLPVAIRATPAPGDGPPVDDDSPFAPDMHE